MAKLSKTEHHIFREEMSALARRRFLKSLRDQEEARREQQKKQPPKPVDLGVETGADVAALVTEAVAEQYGVYYTVFGLRHGRKQDNPSGFVIEIRRASTREMRQPVLVVRSQWTGRQLARRTTTSKRQAMCQGIMGHLYAAAKVAN